MRISGWMFKSAINSILLCIPELNGLIVTAVPPKYLRPAGSVAEFTNWIRQVLKKSKLEKTTSRPTKFISRNVPPGAELYSIFKDPINESHWQPST